MTSTPKNLQAHGRVDVGGFAQRAEGFLTALELFLFGLQLVVNLLDGEVEFEPGKVVRVVVVVYHLHVDLAALGGLKVLTLRHFVGVATDDVVERLLAVLGCDVAQSGGDGVEDVETLDGTDGGVVDLFADERLQLLFALFARELSIKNVCHTVLVFS